MTVWQRTKSDEIFKRNGWYYARFSLLNERVQQNLFIKVDEESGWRSAYEKVNEMKKLILGGKDWKSLFINVNSKRKYDGASLCGEMWPLFYDFRLKGSKIHKKKPWRERTAKEYKAFWDLYFKDFWEDKLPSEINEESWQSYIDYVRKKSKKDDILFFNHHKYFRTFCAYLVQHGKIPSLPVIWNPDPEVEDDDGAGTVYRDEAIAQMIETADMPVKLYIMMGALMGMRSSEITQLHKSRIDLGATMIRLKAKDVKTGSKTGHGRNIPIPGPVLHVLVSQMEKHPKSNYVFPNFRKDDGDRAMDTTGFKKRWDEIRTLAGYPDGRFHDLRHTYATKGFSNPNINPVLLCKALGMSMATAERVYIHFKDEHFRTITENFNFASIGF